MFTSEQDPCSKGIETLGRVVVGTMFVEEEVKQQEGPFEGYQYLEYS